MCQLPFSCSITFFVSCSAERLWHVLKWTNQYLNLLHLLASWIYNAAFPCTLSWWIANIIIMIVLGVFPFMRTEPKAIPLSMDLW